MRFHREYGSGGEEVVKRAGRGQWSLLRLYCVVVNAGSVPRHAADSLTRMSAMLFVESARSTVG
jgi:hypothetical protein